MNAQIKIIRELVDSYCSRSYATIDTNDVAYIEVNEKVLRNEMRDGGDYETIEANYGGAFSPEWEHSDIKLLFILKESYILKDSFYKEGHRGGFYMNKLYNDDDLWENVTYRNIVKITYLTYLENKGQMAIYGDYKSTYIWKDIWEEACSVFRKHAAVISANPFPGLAFNATKTSTHLLKKWLSIPQIISILQSKVQELAPKCVFAAFDLGYVSSYGDLFGWLKGRSFEDLIASEGKLAVLGRRVYTGGRLEQRTFVVDEFNVRWIQGIHPSARLSHKKMHQMAYVIAYAG